MIYWLIAVLIFHIIYGLATCNLYKLAGKKSWQAFVPIYNLWIGLDIMERPKWWIILLHTPIIMVIMWFIYWVDFARSFGKRTWTDAILTILTLGLYSFYLNYIEKPTYEGAEERKSTLISSLLFAIILATIIHTWFIQPMIVPTGSMENTIKIGDALFVEKVSYGARVPFTPIGIPFSEFIKRDAYVDKARLPYMRLPGWRKLKANDIVVFSYPTDSVYNAIDRKDAYVKRLVGLPGDSLKVDNGKLIVNGNEFIPKKDAKVQHSYLVNTTAPLGARYMLEDLGVIEGNDYGIIAQNDKQITYIFRALTNEHVAKLKQYKNVISIEPKLNPKGIKAERIYPRSTKIDSTYTIFPENKSWNEDNYGTLYIPKKGNVITLNKNNLAQYYNIITNYENHKLEEKNGLFYIDGKEAKTYTIEQDYFFMMGDNRNQSLDARFFGYVPEDHIIGRPFMVWANLNQLFGFEAKSGFHWERWFTFMNNDNPNKTSYRYIMLVALILFFGWDYIKARKKKEEKTD